MCLDHLEQSGWAVAAGEIPAMVEEGTIVLPSTDKGIQGLKHLDRANPTIHVVLNNQRHQVRFSLRALQDNGRAQTGGRNYFPVGA